MAVSLRTCFWLSGLWLFSSDASCTYGAAILGIFFYSLAVSTSTSFFYPYPSSIKADYIDYLQSWTYWHVAGYLYRVLGALFCSAGRWLNVWFGVLSCALICHTTVLWWQFWYLSYTCGQRGLIWCIRWHLDLDDLKFHWTGRRLREATCRESSIHVFEVSTPYNNNIDQGLSHIFNKALLHCGTSIHSTSSYSVHTP